MSEIAADNLLSKSRPASWPLIDPFVPDRVAFWTRHGPVCHGELFERAKRLAGELPDCPMAINYCETRDNFATALLAMWMRGQTALLPTDRSEHIFTSLSDEYPQLYSMSDQPLSFDNPSNVLIGEARYDAAPVDEVAQLPSSHVAVKVFTSGSTGKPAVNDKTWGMLVAGGRVIHRLLELDHLSAPAIIATVPSQHMYGFETTVMNVLQSEACTHAEHPVFPADIARCLADAPAPRVLVTTPIHLRALVQSTIELPRIERVISATAPLATELAMAAERRLRAEVWEIYGFTEAGSVAARRTTKMRDWRLREDFTAIEESGRQYVEWSAFDLQIPFPDNVEILDPKHVHLVGRTQDMVNIAGKRASISGLTALLLDIDGVHDGAFWLPSEDEGLGTVSRLMAFVVAPRCTEDDLRRALKLRLDAAFVPRKIVFVDALPRNATGKLTQGTMSELAAPYLARDANT